MEDLNFVIGNLLEISDFCEIIKLTHIRRRHFTEASWVGNAERRSESEESPESLEFNCLTRMRHTNLIKLTWERKFYNLYISIQEFGRQRYIGYGFAHEQ